MTEEDELKRFREENRDMIERILAEEREKARSEEESRKARILAKREELEKLRMELEELSAQEADRAYRHARESRERRKDIMREEADRAYRDLRESRERARIYSEAEREYAIRRMDEARSRFKENRDIIRDRVGEDVSDTFGFLNDPQFQKHLVGAGLEAFAALNSLVKASPVIPDEFKDAVDDFEQNKNKAYCRKNEHCYSKKNPYRQSGTDRNNEGPVKIKIEDSGDDGRRVPIDIEPDDREEEKKE